MDKMCFQTRWHPFECMTCRNIPWGAVEGIGMGVPGPVDDDGTVFRCVNLGWGVFNIPKQIRKLGPGINKVRVSNDVNAAALGELWKGAAQEHHSAF